MEEIEELKEQTKVLKQQLALTEPSGTVSLFRPNQLKAMIDANEAVIKWSKGLGKC